MASSDVAALAKLLLTALLLTFLGPAAAGALAHDEANATNNVSNATKAIHTVPLRKQYVPIVKNGAAIAYKTAYFGQIYAGSPTSQPFTVVFDTGSGHLILPSTACRSETCVKHRQYDRLASKSAVDIEYDGTPILPTAQERDQLRISFGTGSVEGEFVEDVACLGATGTEGAHCTSLRIVLATSMSPEPFGLFDFDGVLGLGANALALNSHFNFFGQMVAQHPSMQPRFAVRLARNDQGRSAISFGGVDDRWLAPGQDVRWAPVAMPELGYWQVRIKEVRIGDTVLDDCADGGCRAILDTGTSLLGVPRQAMRGMHRLLARPVPDELSHPGDDPDCRALAGKMLDFDLDLEGNVVSLGPEDYSRPTPYNMTMPGGNGAWKLWCRSLLLPIDMKEPLGPRVFIWGEAVLRRYLTVYDWENQRVGFAVSRTKDEPVDVESGAVGAPPAGSLAAGSPLVEPAAAPFAAEVRA